MIRLQPKRNQSIGIINRMKKQCVICGAELKVILHTDRSYRGGHYFGKIPMHRKREVLHAIKAGTHNVQRGSYTLNVLNRDPKSYGEYEYWECPKCYRKG